MAHNNQQKRVRAEKGDDRQDWMTSGELCQYLNILPRRFRRWQQAKKIPEPAARTKSGYGLWSPEQITEVLNLRIKP